MVRKSVPGSLNSDTKRLASPSRSPEKMGAWESLFKLLKKSRTRRCSAKEQTALLKWEGKKFAAKDDTCITQDSKAANATQKTRSMGTNPRGYNTPADVNTRRVAKIFYQHALRGAMHVRAKW